MQRTVCTPCQRMRLFPEHPPPNRLQIYGAHATHIITQMRTKGEAVEKEPGPVSTEQEHRTQTGAHLPTGQPSPEPKRGAANDAGSSAKNAGCQRLWKSRCAWESRKLREIPTFPQPQQQQTFGYISNVSTTPATVTFLDGLTGIHALSLRPLRTARAQKLVSTLDARTPNHKS